MITTTNTLNNKEAHGFVGANGINFDVERSEIDPVIDAIEQILINRYDYTFRCSVIYYLFCMCLLVFVYYFF